MKEGSSTNSSRRWLSLRGLYSLRTRSAAPFTMHALPSERLTAANNQIQSERKRSGSTSMLERGSRMPLLQTQRSLSVSSLNNIPFPRPLMLEAAWGSISIGPWQYKFNLKNGSGTLRDSVSYAWKTVYKLTLFELAIWRLYLELPEPTTENPLQSSSKSEI